MATLTLAGFGLRPAQNFLGAAPTYQANVYYIKKGYATAIGFGDLVETRTGSTAYGYVGIYTAGDSHSLGVFAGVMPYYDTVLQQYVNKPWWAGTENAAGDVACWVVDDPFAVFTVQIGGTQSGVNPATNLLRGGNIDLALNGSPNTSTGISTAYADATTYNNTTATLPLRVLGLSQMFQPGYDPTLNYATQPTNNYLQVRLNTSENITATGI